MVRVFDAINVIQMTKALGLLKGKDMYIIQRWTRLLLA